MKPAYHILLASVTALALIATSCSGGSDKRNEHNKYDEWHRSLGDSLKCVQAEMDRCNQSIDSLHAAVQGALPDFDHIDNPREVEGYTIYKGWKGRYPLTTTGMVARMCENTSLELVATLRGGNFESISVSAGGESVRSETVPHDQALNYRANGLNTVSFSGKQADAVAAFIANHRNEPITLNFHGKGAPARCTLPRDQVQMIAETWDLVNAYHSSKLLEHRLTLLQEKLKILQAHQLREN